MLYRTYEEKGRQGNGENGASGRPTPEGKVRIEAKDDLKARLGRSPDKADAVVMAVAADAARKRRPRAGIATA